ncbi:MAG TPA: HAD family hydrolase [Gemmatimonadaceae bacterium]|nr:HAD family hydrolase [Gemmatimonadaceae bacterium]
MRPVISFDYWDTLYAGAALPERVARRRAALRRMLDALGAAVPDETLAALYEASGEEAERWWREEHRGYTTEERIRWILARLGIERPAGCEHVRLVCAAVDDVLVELPPPLLPGAGDMVRALAVRHELAIISDTGFASGRAQDRLLERDGLLHHFRARVYSMDIGHAKPRPEPFAAAARALGVPPERVIHVGDNERTDVRGALDAGMRAIRLDIVHRRGASAAELVARSYDELLEYLADAA